MSKIIMRDSVMSKVVMFIIEWIVGVILAYTAMAIAGGIIWVTKKIGKQIDKVRVKMADRKHRRREAQIEIERLIKKKELEVMVWFSNVRDELIKEGYSDAEIIGTSGVRYTGDDGEYKWISYNQDGAYTI